MRKLIRLLIIFFSLWLESFITYSSYSGNLPYNQVFLV